MVKITATTMTTAAAATTATPTVAASPPQPPKKMAAEKNGIDRNEGSHGGERVPMPARTALRRRTLAKPRGGMIIK